MRLMVYCCLLSGCSGANTIETLFENGNRTMKDGHYADAVG